MGGVGYVATRISRPASSTRPAPSSAWSSANATAGARRAPKRCLRPRSQRGIQAELSTDIRRAIWEKCSCSWSGCPAPRRRCAGASALIRENPQTRAFLFELMKEVGRASAARHGVALPEDYAASAALSPIRSRPT